MSYRDDDDDFNGLTDAELMREAEEPDNPQRTSIGLEERQAACRALRARGYSESEVSAISAGTYHGRD